MYDLHCHSVFSDGVVTPKEICRRAKERGLTGIALSDHDTVDGLNEMAEACAHFDLDFVPAVEFAGDFHGKEAHLLAYFVDPNSPTLRVLLDRVKKSREERTAILLDKLKQGGIKLSYQKLQAMAPHLITRSHVARLLVEEGHARSEGEAFSRLIGHGAPYYVPKTAIPLTEIVSCLKELPVVTSLAHPISLKDDVCVHEILDLGVDALEIANEKMDFKDMLHYAHLAEKKGKRMTAGSDCHGLTVHHHIFLGQFALSDEAFATLKNLYRARLRR